ncbi:MAG: ABC transporter permease [Bacteroidota bacterium]
MFDLDKSLAAWRQGYAHNQAFSTEDLDELEQHIRDQVAALVMTGISQKDAFDLALRDMGGKEEATREYDKVFWAKAKREHRVKEALLWRYGMLKNYMRVALRTMQKQKVYTAINIVGLAVGIACFIIIMRFVQYEFSFDRFFPGHEDIYRVTKRVPGDVYLGTDHFALTQAPLAPAMMTDFPEVTHATAFQYQEALLQAENNKFTTEGLSADQHYFEVFAIQLVQGAAATALVAPNSIVLTESLAGKLFGAADPMGRTLRMDDQTSYLVTGLMADVPANASVQYDFVTSIITDAYYNSQLDEDRWNSNYLYTFFRTAPGTDFHALQKKLPALADRKIYAGNEDTPNNERERFYIQSLADVHLRSTANFDVGRHGSRARVFLFLAIGCIILLLACINYVNLAVARSIKRAAEVGLRKTVGADKSQLIWQFIGESFLMTGLALLMALVLTHLLLPHFAQLVNRTLTLNYFAQPWLVPALFVLLVLVALLAGSYPALHMAALPPLRALKRKQRHRKYKFSLQQTLIVGQFTASIILVTCGYVIYQQLEFVQNKALGYDRAHILNIAIQDNNDALKARRQQVQAALKQHSSVAQVTASHSLPTNISMKQNIRNWPGSEPEASLPIHVNAVDYGFEELFGIALIAGRTFSPAFPTDLESASIINETTARALGWSPDEALGKTFRHDRRARTVIGVVQDFHMHSMHHQIKPLLFFLDDGGRFEYISVKLQPGNVDESLAAVQEIVRTASSYPVEYSFLDDTFDSLYAQEKRLGATFNFFTMLAFLIAALGLFGQAAYAAEQRTKEIGVRKVLGASPGNIVYMLSKEFTNLVLLAALFAVPIAYLATSHWLEGFVYRVDIGLGAFLLATCSALGIAIASVGYQSLRAALRKPARSLRFE